MTPLLLRAGVRHLARHPWQLALAVVGVAIGVAVVVGVDLASESARRAFRLSTEATSGRATHQVTGGTAGLDERVYPLLRLEGGVRAAAPVVEVIATLPASGDRAVRLLGIDPFAEGALRPWLASGSGGPLALAQLVGEPGAALLSAETAAELGLAPGDRFPVRSGGRTGELRLAGLLAPDAASRAALSNLLVADVATAQELAGTAGLLTRIDLLLPEGAEGDREAARIAALLATESGVPARLEPAASRPAVLDQMTRAFRLNLAALS
ncbi:MAG TPA: ABC transporter permease, partial [Thermoanaerobaculia bacterium]|nr:ABC transporter permease [Thermoanaerobaculia bacterium]